MENKKNNKLTLWQGSHVLDIPFIGLSYLSSIHTLLENKRFIFDSNSFSGLLHAIIRSVLKTASLIFPQPLDNLFTHLSHAFSQWNHEVR